jgi:anti-sigma B factor antagonist
MMEIKVETMKRCELVTLSGQIDSATAPEFEQTLLDLIDSGKKNLVINFRDVTFISSPGLKALLAAQIKVRRKVPSGEVLIAEISPKLKEVLDLVGLHHLFTFYDTEVEAVGSF